MSKPRYWRYKPMHSDPVGGLFVPFLFLLMSLKLVLGTSGIFRGCVEGWWAAFWHRLLIGPRRPSSMNPIGCVLFVLLALLSIGCIGSVLLPLLSGITGSIPAK